jgi:hypothetical protein
MKNVFAVLRERETDLARVREEIKALRFVIPLLAEESASAAPTMAEISTVPSQLGNKWPLDVRVTTP